MSIHISFGKYWAFIEEWYGFGSIGPLPESGEFKGFLFIWRYKFGVVMILKKGDNDF
jgi:hypothetical protein